MVVPSENPHHEAIDLLGAKHHARRIDEFLHGSLPGSYPGAPERDATNSDRLAWARRDWAAGKPDEVIDFASRVLSSPEASPAQTAEALRLRGIARARKGLFSAAVTDAEDALVLEPYATGTVSASDLRELLAHWKLIPDRRPLIGPWG
jgi:hypothetical protein